MGAFFTALIALMQSAPAIERLFTEFFKAYSEWAALNKKKEFHEALKNAMKTFDQRALEGEGVSGAPSGREGVTFRERSKK